MRLSPLFKCFGSKWQSARHYPAPVHDHIIEPFAGGAGYSLNHSERQCVIWEDDPHVFKLWSWLVTEAHAQDILDIPLNLPAGQDIREVGLSPGQELLLKHWQRTNNVGSCWTISSWGHLPGQWTANTRARVAEEVYGVKHWEIRDSVFYLDTPCTFFLDPPYLHNYRYSRSLPAFDYSALCRYVSRIHPESLVIACEAVGKNGDIPDYLPFVQSHRSITSRRKQTQSHHSNELIYVRQPRSRDESIT